MIAINSQTHLCLEYLRERYHDSLIIELYANYIYCNEYMANSQKRYNLEDKHIYEILYQSKVQLHDLVSLLYDGYEIDEKEHELLIRMIDAFISDSRIKNTDLVYDFVFNVLDLYEIDTSELIQKIGYKVDEWS